MNLQLPSFRVSNLIDKVYAKLVCACTIPCVAVVKTGGHNLTHPSMRGYCNTRCVLVIFSILKLEWENEKQSYNLKLWVCNRRLLQLEYSKLTPLPAPSCGYSYEFHTLAGIQRVTLGEPTGLHAPIGFLTFFPFE